MELTKEKIEKANEVLKDLKNIYGYNFLVNTNKRICTDPRAMFLYILYHKHLFKRDEISLFLKSKKLHRKGSNISIAINKLESRLKYNKVSSIVFEKYFPARALVISDKLADTNTELKEVYKKRVLNDIYNNIENSKILKLINIIPKEKEKEIIDLIELRIKSWAWKNKNECDIIECSA